MICSRKQDFYLEKSVLTALECLKSRTRNKWFNLSNWVTFSWCPLNDGFTWCLVTLPLIYRCHVMSCLTSPISCTSLIFNGSEHGEVTQSHGGNRFDFFKWHAPNAYCRPTLLQPLDINQVRQLQLSDQMENHFFHHFRSPPWNKDFSLRNEFWRC